MPEIKPNFLIENLSKITRNYNSKNESNSPVLNTIFNWFDTDHNGTFSEDEWVKKEKYAQDLQTKFNTNYDEKVSKENSAVKFYRNKVDLLSKELKKIDTQINKIYEEQNYYAQMLNFEKAHGIKRDGYNKKSKIPNDATAIDISMFGMGKLDDKGEALKGKTYKKGYIIFPDKISDADKQAYLELLNKAQEQCEQVEKLMQRWKQTEKEYDTAVEDYNMVKSGKIKKFDSQAQVYQRDQAIRESSNPYYKQYKDLEQKYNALRLKPNLTEKEASLLIQYSQILKQLKGASLSWSSPQVNKSTSTSSSSKSATATEAEEESNNGFSITNIDEKISYDNGEISDEHSAGISYTQNKWNAIVTGSETEKYKDDKTKHEGFFTIGGTYNASKSISISPELVFSGTDSSTTWTLGLGASYAGDSNLLSFKASREYINVKESSYNSENKSKNENEIEENLSGSSYATKLEFEWQKSFNNGISTSVISDAKFDKKQGNNYSLSLGAQTPLFKNKLAKHNLSWSASGNLTGSYESLVHATVINPSISTSLNYNKNDFSTGISCQENYSTILVDGESIPNQMFMASGTVGYKQLSFKAGCTSTQNSYIDMTNIDAEASFATKKAGTFSAIFGYTNTAIKDSEKTDKGFNFSFGYSVPVDFLNNLFKKSKKKQEP